MTTNENPKYNKAFTLIETIVYIVLLSILTTGLVQYIYGMMSTNLKLNDDIEKAYKKESGFGALIAVLLLSFGLLATCLTTLGYSYSFADFVNRKELRIQASMNAESCVSNIEEELRQDYFLDGKIFIKELGCDIAISLVVGGPNSSSAEYVVEVVAELVRVKSYVTREIKISHTD